jgi:hypothetical protein
MPVLGLECDGDYLNRYMICLQLLYNFVQLQQIFLKSTTGYVRPTCRKRDPIFNFKKKKEKKKEKEKVIKILQELYISCKRIIYHLNH